ncbi:site-specific integrase [Nocardia amamiensis]|uniref:Site-specific integrase n=1 Tax=Nocardia amamiensis TaxID=404578 RepID=A0ABS0CNL6_9NOCA|nr:site-specific integrase [Nocardia amamiensis]MBF6298197.1 site-specific integrase [Nocardia amamiensis]
MASIRTRKSRDGITSYQLQYRHEGRQPSIEFADYADAAKWRDRFNDLGPATALEMLRIENSDSPCVRLKEAGIEYIDSLTRAEDGTRNRYRAYMRNDIEPFFNSALPVDAITEALVVKWINHLSRVVGNAPKTVANKHGYLFGLMDSLRRQGIITKNPCEGTKLPRVDQAEMTFLEPDEFAALEEALPEQWRLLVRFLVASGVRWGEATALRVGDVDRRHNTIRIRRAWKYTGGARVLGAPKTKKSKRTINVDPDLIAELPLSGRTYGAWLFTNRQGNAIQISTFYKQVWVPTLARLATDPADPLHGKTPRIHDLRHTCASWMLDEGVPIGDVQEHMGHESIQTTKDRYGHCSRDAGKRAAAAIGKRLTKPKPHLAAVA